MRQVASGVKHSLFRRAEDATRAAKEGLQLEKFLVRLMRRIDHLGVTGSSVMRFVAERLIREVGWPRRLLGDDARFRPPIKVHLSPVLRAMQRRLAPPRTIWKPG